MVLQGKHKLRKKKKKRIKNDTINSEGEKEGGGECMKEGKGGKKERKRKGE